MKRKCRLCSNRKEDTESRFVGGMGLQMCCLACQKWADNEHKKDQKRDRTVRDQVGGHGPMSRRK